MDVSNFTEREMVIFSNPESIIEELQRLGVHGLLILDKIGICLLLREYTSSLGIFRIDNADLLTGFISAINSYSDSINGFLTDIGLGGFIG